MLHEYDGMGCAVCGSVNAGWYARPKDMEEAMMRGLLAELAALVFERGPGAEPQLLPQLALSGGAQLMTAVLDNWRKRTVDIEYNSPDMPMLAYIRGNIFAFSSARNLVQYQEYSAALLDADGKLRPWYLFRQEAAKITDGIVSRHLRAEYNNAVASAQMASRWLTIQENKDVAPNLRYITAGDGAVRPAHAALDGIVLPVDDRFWDSYYPPNGWNCRCDVSQVSSAVTKDRGGAFDKAKAAKVPSYFKGNAGKTGVVFTDEHPYFTQYPNLENMQAVADYGMPTTESIYSRPSRLAQRLPELQSEQAWRDWYDKLPEKDLPTVFPELKIRSTRANAEHIVEEKKQERWRYANHLGEILKDPDEVWLSSHTPKKSTKEYFTLRFIKYYEGNPIIVQTEFQNNGLELVTMYDTSYRSRPETAKDDGRKYPFDLNKERKGILMAKK